METPFYHDDVIRARGDIASDYSDDTMMKKDMSVNLSEPSSALKPPVRGSDALLSSTDAGLLKLASPELERLIIQSNGMVTTTPTSQFLYQKAVSDEQEFAEGFVKALEDLHKQNQLGGGGGGHTGSLELGSNTPAVTAHPDLPVYTNLSSYGSGPLGTTVNYSTDTVPFPPPPPPPSSSTTHHLGGAQHAAHARLQSLKDEPQTVPDVQSFGESPPLSPINMDTQERIKAERKKLRNRIAASKCRKRKLERISRLEDKVKTLKTQNTDLASTASLLREQVAQLKQKVMNHVNSGCQLLPHQVQAY
ncbi:transcription factor jun-D-like [Scleropages formosus]|uniref:Transcription factor JunD n=2 Tax=Scleropages formosus TaxID=113540 RepID=A0A0P7XQG2_SCLFO|nr:transcription factor jun-D [Scleropages formosus]KPP79139.1 transcription factor jun-D-like [Scleropages formosus]